MQPQSWLDVAKLVLTKGKHLAPDRFPAPNPDVAEAWAEVLERIGLPWQIWPEAITWWSMNVAGDRMITPRALKEAGIVIRDRWENGRNPEKLELLATSRHRRLALNYRQALGSDGGAQDVLVVGQPAALGPGSGPALPGSRNDTERSWRAIRAEARRRAALEQGPGNGATNNNSGGMPEEGA